MTGTLKNSNTSDAIIGLFIDAACPSIAHHGVPEQKWYERNYQYYDGSLTPLGRVHYDVGPPREPGKRSDDRVRKKGTGYDEAKAEAKRAKSKDNDEALRIRSKKKAKPAATYVDKNNKKKLDKAKDELSEKDKQKLIREADPKKLWEYSNQLSDNELQSALNRARNTQALADMVAAQLTKEDIARKQNSAFAKTQALMATVATTIQLVDQGAKYASWAKSMVNQWSRKKYGSSPEAIFKHQNLYSSKELEALSKRFTSTKNIANYAGWLAEKKAEANKTQNKDDEDKK